MSTSGLSSQLPTFLEFLGGTTSVYSLQTEARPKDKEDKRHTPSHRRPSTHEGRLYLVERLREYAQRGFNPFIRPVLFHHRGMAREVDIQVTRVTSVTL